MFTMPVGGLFVVQARWTLLIITFCCFFIISAQRINTGFAILTMVNWKSIRNKTAAFCPVTHNETLTSEEGEFEWSIGLQAQILNSYFYGLILLVLPAELLVERFKPQYLALVGMLLSTVCNFVTSEAARWDISGLIYVQIAKGMGHAVVMPAFSVMFGKWIPTSMLIRFMTYAGCGIPTGAFITVLMGGVISSNQDYGWTYLFYYPGVMGLIWCIVWLYLCCDMRFMPVLTSHRRFHTTTFPKREHPIPLRKILMSKSFWGYVSAGVATYWMIAFNILVMPSYFHIVYNIDIEWNGLLSSFPNVLQAFLFLLSNVLSDRLLDKKLVDKTSMRRCTVCTGLSIYATSMVILTFVNCSPALGTLLVMTGIGALGLNLAALSLIPMDMSPNFSGIMTGIMNTIGTFVACALPLMIEFVTDEKSELREWHKIFYASAFIAFIGMILFMAFSSSDIQSWNTPGTGFRLTSIELPSTSVSNTTSKVTAKEHSSKHQGGNKKFSKQKPVNKDDSKDQPITNYEELNSL